MENDVATTAGIAEIAVEIGDIELRDPALEDAYQSILVPGPWVTFWHFQFLVLIMPLWGPGSPRYALIAAYQRLQETFAVLDHPRTGAFIPLSSELVDELPERIIPTVFGVQLDIEMREMHRIGLHSTLSDMLDQLQLLEFCDIVNVPLFATWQRRAIKVFKDVLEIIVTDKPPKDQESAHQMDDTDPDDRISLLGRPFITRDPPMNFLRSFVAPKTLAEAEEEEAERGQVGEGSKRKSRMKDRRGDDDDDDDEYKDGDDGNDDGDDDDDDDEYKDGDDGIDDGDGGDGGDDGNDNNKKKDGDQRRRWLKGPGNQSIQ